LDCDKTGENLIISISIEDVLYGYNCKISYSLAIQKENCYRYKYDTLYRSLGENSLINLEKGAIWSLGENSLINLEKGAIWSLGENSLINLEKGAIWSLGGNSLQAWKRGRFGHWVRIL